MSFRRRLYGCGREPFPQPEFLSADDAADFPGTPFPRLFRRNLSDRARRFSAVPEIDAAGGIRPERDFKRGFSRKYLAGAQSGALFRMRRGGLLRSAASAARTDCLGVLADAR